MNGAIAFSGNGRFLASAATPEENGEVRIWDVQTHQQVGAPVPAPKFVSAVALSTGGELLAFGGEDKKVEVWELKRRVRVASAIDGTGSVAFSPDGKHLLTNPAGNSQRSAGSSLQVWDLISGQAVGAPMQLDVSSIRHIIFLGDGTRALVVGWDTWVLWDLAAEVEIGIPVQVNLRFEDAHVSSDLSELTATTMFGGFYAWNFGKGLNVHGTALMNLVCTQVLPGSLSKLLAEELAAAPVLNPRLDGDGCPGR
jgi:hypothetical protein